MTNLKQDVLDEAAARLSGIRQADVQKSDSLGPFVAVPDQYFASRADWVSSARYVLTCHPKYLNTEHDGPEKGWRGEHFTALCFDQLGRRVRIGADFKKAEEDDAFPVWWVWPDQIAELIMGGK